MSDVIELTQQLIRCPSVTPDEGGALVILADFLQKGGFKVRRMDRSGIANLYAWHGDGAPNLCFAGHTDVVPVGDRALWSYDPFGGEIDEGKIWGRGAADMKSAVAAFCVAGVDYIKKNSNHKGTLSFMITGDEEGEAAHGTVAILDILANEGIALSDCIVGEPTCPNQMGEMIKVGRRGSIHFTLTAKGTQGHSAYPERSHNPIPVLVKLLNHLADYRLDQGCKDFEPSNLAITTIDVGNLTENMTPTQVSARINIRFNPLHTAERLKALIQAKIMEVATEGVVIEMTARCSGEAFLTPSGFLRDLVSHAVEKQCGMIPAASTSGGTSDARFIKKYCPVVECGLVGATMHQANEHVDIGDLKALKNLYHDIILRYFNF